VIDEWLHAVTGGVWALPTLFALVLADSFLVVLPGEAAVTAFGALAVSTGSPPLALVIAVAALAAVCGDAVLFSVGRSVGLERWRWMRAPRAQTAFAWARVRLQRSAGAVVFTARFIPFARIAVNLTAGAAGISAARFLAIDALAAVGWAAYQAVIGAVVGWVVPGGPGVAVLVSIGVALALGFALDAVVTRVGRRRASKTAP
jgi:membrane protein DedA with SNARE-associated domain